MFFWKKKKEVSNENETRPLESYDQSFKTQKIKVMVTIVPRGQGQFYLKKFQEIGAPASFLVFGKGTAEKEIYEILGISDTRKDIVFTLGSESLIPLIKNVIEEKFASNKKAKGIAFAFELNSVAGVLAYKYLSNTRVNVRKEKVVENGTRREESSQKPESNGAKPRRKTL